MKSAAYVVLGLSLLVVGTPFTRAANPPPASVEFGLISYPASGNIQVDEGTVDLWIVNDFDSDYPPDKSGKDLNWQATLFNVVFPEQNWHYPLYFIAWANGYAWVGYADPPQPYVWMGPPHWKPGEVHHIVMTWSGRKRSIFIDGICEWQGIKGKNVARDVDVGAPIRGDLTTALLQVGSSRSFLTIDEIQIRNIALTPEEIVAAKDAPLTADSRTLLLDRCDGGPPEIILGGGEGGRKLTGVYQIVDGKFGKAIRLWKEKK
jgi:hypothetical protein